METLVKERPKQVIKKEEKRDFCKILIVGASGKGKTYGFRNMNDSSTGFINVENKPLPFKKPFKYHARPKTYAGFLKALEDYIANSEIDCIVIDSFSAAIDMLLEEMRVKFKGYDIWSNYNKHVGELFKSIKTASKEVIITAHYELLNIESDSEKRVKIKGKEFEGMVEKEFTIVLYADSKFKNDKPVYSYVTVGEDISAKCPPGVFEDDAVRVDNDAAMVLKQVRAFYEN